MRNHLNAFELLEPRRLYANNLFANDDGTEPLPTLVKPGHDIAITARIYNIGGTLVTTDFVLGARLVPTALVPDTRVPPSQVPQSPQWDLPGAIALAQKTITQNIGSASSEVASYSGTIPANTPPGTYRLIQKVDVTNTVPESDEFNEWQIAILQVLAPDGVMKVRGQETADNWTIANTGLYVNDLTITAANPGYVWSFQGDTVTQLEISSLGGDDTIVIGDVPIPFVVDGGSGNDKIVGGPGNDTLVGGANKDVLDGGGGNDRLNGNGGNDKLLGNAGADRLFGYDGDDVLDGGSSNDRFDGGGGSDTMYGQSGNDTSNVKDGAIDYLFGASGNDIAQVDASDILSSIETPIVT